MVIGMYLGAVIVVVLLLAHRLIPASTATQVTPQAVPE
jgi:hypothetical protein